MIELRGKDSNYKPLCPNLEFYIIVSFRESFVKLLLLYKNQTSLIKIIK